MLAMDIHGNLSGACTTSGLAFLEAVPKGGYAGIMAFASNITGADINYFATNGITEAEIVAIRLSFTTVCIALKEFGLDKESDSYKDCLNIYTVLEKLIKKIEY